MTGCEYINKMLERPLPEGAFAAELVIHADDGVYRYACIVDPTTKQLIDCTEVK